MARQLLSTCDFSKFDAFSKHACGDADGGTFAFDGGKATLGRKGNVIREGTLIKVGKEPPLPCVCQLCV